MQSQSTQQLIIMKFSIFFIVMGALIGSLTEGASPIDEEIDIDSIISELKTLWDKNKLANNNKPRSGNNEINTQESPNMSPFDTDGGYDRKTETSKMMDQWDQVTTQASKILEGKMKGKSEKDEEFKNKLNEIMENLVNRAESLKSGIIDFKNLCLEVSPKCDSKAKYRNLDGTCNNLKNGLWGSKDVALRRYLKDQYADDLGFQPRGTKTNLESRLFGKPDIKEHSGTSCPSDPSRPLPSARHISVKLNIDKSEPSNVHTVMAMQMGQFLDHDISLTPPSSVFAHCCARPSQGNCFAIPAPPGDETFPSECIHFVRSVHHCRKGGSLRQQMNAVTAFVDASHVYGSFSRRGSNLRAHKKGLLATSRTGDLIPTIGTGDLRSGSLPTLTSMHTLLLREHNRIAKKLETILKGKNRKMSEKDLDELIFQESRRILIAEWQNIVFNEYVPLLVGQREWKKGKMNVDVDSKYDPTVDPSIRNSFATAAYRFGHSQISNFFDTFDCKSDEPLESMKQEDMFFDLSSYKADGGRGFDRIMSGLIRIPTEKTDRFFSQSVSNKLFGRPNDLVSRNIQRGRDHGLPAYNDFRKFCGMDPICSWNKRPREISPQNWKILQDLYPHPIDIDLYVGGISEDIFLDGMTGRTFNCINTKQFRAFKDGDRFFFTHSNGAANFNKDQLKNIRSRTLADLICDNTDVKEIRSRVMELNSTMTCCASRNQLDVDLFAKTI